MKMIPQTEEGLASMFPCEEHRAGCTHNATREVEPSPFGPLERVLGSRIVCESCGLHMLPLGWRETEESAGDDPLAARPASQAP